MKKFFFSLDTVLNYKEQALDGLKAEHARILAKDGGGTSALYGGVPE